MLHLFSDDERKGFYDWITDEQSIEDEGKLDGLLNRLVLYWIWIVSFFN
jgi:hypothetical protein